MALTSLALWYSSPLLVTCRGLFCCWCVLWPWCICSLSESVSYHTSRCRAPSCFAITFFWDLSFLVVNYKAHQPRKKIFLLWQQGLWAGYVFSEVTKLELVNINSWVLSVWKRCWNLAWRVSICGSIPWRDWDSTSDPQVALAGKNICPFVCLIMFWVMKPVAKQIREAGSIAAWMSF